MAGAVRKTRMKEVPLSEIKDDLSRFLREAEKQEIVDNSAWKACRRVDRIRIRGRLV